MRRCGGRKLGEGAWGVWSCASRSSRGALCAKRTIHSALFSHTVPTIASRPGTPGPLRAGVL